MCQTHLVFAQVLDLEAAILRVPEHLGMLLRNGVRLAYLEVSRVTVLFLATEHDFRDALHHVELAALLRDKLGASHRWIGLD